jgi:hypothetical protein
VPVSSAVASTLGLQQGSSGVVLDDDLVERIDEILDPVVERDPAKTR